MIVINKEAGYTSSDVVAKLRGILHMRRIGHTGTLDPEAVGVLPVCLGNGTKLVELIADRDKEYEAVLRLGVTTDTQDMTGTVLTQTPEDEVLEKLQQSAGELRRDDQNNNSVNCQVRRLIEETIKSFLGEIEQIPPMYSAVQVNGKRLYELAREGKTVERKPRKVMIHEIEVLDVAGTRVRLRVRCGKGTYIRTLCEDIGNALGVGGAMEHLTRTRVGQFRLEQALTLEELDVLMHGGPEKVAEAERHIIPIDAFFDEAPKLIVKSEFLRYLQNGNPIEAGDVLPFSDEEDKASSDGICAIGRDGAAGSGAPMRSDGLQVRMYDEQGNFYALYQWSAGRRRYVPLKMFYSPELAGQEKKRESAKA